MNETITNDEQVNICGVMVHARPEYLSQVEEQLQGKEGVEVHATNEQGRMVVTIEHHDRHRVMDILSNIQDIKGVLSAAMVYQQSV